MSEPSPPTAGQGRKPAAKIRVVEWLRQLDPVEVDEGVRQQLFDAFPDLSHSTLREAIRQSNWSLSPLVEGVRQDTRENVKRTLIALAQLYVSAEPLRRKAIRDEVITARQHAEWAARSKKLAEEKRLEKQENLLWIRTWLENPPLFESWLALRLRRSNTELPAREERS